MVQLPFEALLKHKFDNLSAGQKKVALYLAKHLDESAFSTAFQIGRRADVSETTVIRLSYALGYDGFSEMQTIIQQELLQKTHSHFLIKKKDSASQSPNRQPFSRIIENEIHVLHHLLHNLNVEVIWKAVDMLIKADQILIAGYRASYASAYWFSHSLSMLRGNVTLSSPGGDFYEKFSSLTNQSLVFVISLPRYATESLKIAECAKEKGISLLSVTDRLLSPVGRISDITLTTEETAETAANSIASAISLLELIIEGIGIADQKRVLEHQQKLEQLYTKNKIFIE